MSYDLAVFDPRNDLRKRPAFDEWYENVTEWEGTYSYDSPDHATPALRAWFLEMQEKFPAMNGPFAPPPSEPYVDHRSADYSIAPDLIYVAFSWGDVELAYDTCIQLAAKHRIGFLDASGDDGAAWFPAGNDELEIVHVHGQE